MNRSVHYHKQKDKPLEVEVSKIPTWDDFDKLLTFLKKYYEAIIVESFDGIESRKYILESYGVKYELKHDEFFGNTIIALDLSGEQLIREIGDDLDKRLRFL